MSIAVIYCAGYGTRLGKLTADKPKCMIDVGGKPCLERIVEKFEGSGIKNIIVNTHWKPLEIMSYFKDRLLYTFEPELLGEDNTLKGLSKWLKDDFVFVCNGDTLSDISLTMLFDVAVQYGCNVRHMDGETYAGYMLLHPDFFRGNKKFIDFKTESYWVDIGTTKGLAEARKHYDKNKSQF